MGNCSCVSFDSSQVEVEANTTVKLIVPDGALQEYSFPIKVSYLLQANPGYFICNSDEMEFDAAVKAVSENDVLRPGQLYFALPLYRLNKPLRAEEMASLAVKATAGLAKSGDEKKSGSCRKEVVLCPDEESIRNCNKVANKVGLSRVNSRHGGGGGGGGNKGKLTRMLSSITE